jgi:hypothetical protein
MSLLLDAEARLFAVPVAPAREAREIAPRKALKSAPAERERELAQPVALKSALAEAARELAPVPAPWPGVSEPGATLDDLLSETWEGLTSATSPAACPVCDGELVRRWSAGAGVVGGRCRDCGTELS